MSVTQDIKSRLDIVDIVSEQVPLRRSGRNFSGFCPFHTNTRTPAFYVFPETQTWHCFGECAEGGDLFNYVMKKEGWDFKEALKQLAKRAGVELEEADPEVKRRRKAEDKLVDILSTAAEYFHQLLLHAPQAEGARQYVAGRELTAETVGTYRLGFALNSWDACRTHFNDQGYSDDELIAVGLLTENPEKGTRYDRFRNRLMIPIRDVDGRVVGFGARTLEKEGIPKYLNSPQTALFDKGRLLYGLDMARRYIREAREVVIVEGYMDVMQGWQAGYRNIVAQMGTALTGDQIKLLQDYSGRYNKRSVLALDPDPAGIKATMRDLQVARDNTEPEPDTTFTHGRRQRDKRRLQVDFYIALLPVGYDPDNLIRTNPDQWSKIIAEAEPLTDYVIKVETKDLDLDDARAKSVAAQQILPLIEDFEDEVKREHYRQKLAQTLRIDELTLRRMQRQGEVDRKQTYAAPPAPREENLIQPNNQMIVDGNSTVSSRSSDKRLMNLMRQCLEHPRLIIQVNQALLRQEQSPVSEGDFYLHEDGLILTMIYERADKAAVVTIEEMCDSLDSVLLERMEMLLALPAAADVAGPRRADRLAMSLLDARLAKAQAEIDQLQQLIWDDQDRGKKTSDSAQLYRSRIKELVLAVKWINKAKDATSASGQRRAEQSNGR